MEEEEQEEEERQASWILIMSFHLPNLRDYHMMIENFITRL